MPAVEPRTEADSESEDDEDKYDERTSRATISAAAAASALEAAVAHQRGSFKSFLGVGTSTRGFKLKKGLTVDIFVESAGRKVPMVIKKIDVRNGIAQLSPGTESPADVPLTLFVTITQCEEALQDTMIAAMSSVLEKKKIEAAASSQPEQAFKALPLESLDLGSLRSRVGKWNAVKSKAAVAAAIRKSMRANGSFGGDHLIAAARGHGPQSTVFACVGSGEDNILRCPRAPPMIEGSLDLVEFQKIEYLCKETDGSILLTVVRRGPALGILTVGFRNLNVNMDARYFAAVDSTLEFAPGEREASFAIEIILNPVWKVEQVMTVELYVLPGKEKWGSSQFIFGEVVQCRVVVLNEHEFPTDVDDLDNPWETIVSFIFHVAREFPNETRWGLAWKLVPGFTMVLDEIATLLLINIIEAGATHRTALVDDEKADANVMQRDIFLLGMCYALVFALMYLQDVKFLNLRIQEKVMKSFRNSAAQHVIELASGCQVRTPRKQELPDAQTR